MSSFMRSLNTFSGGAAHGFGQGAAIANRNKLTGLEEQNLGMKTDMYERQKKSYEELGQLVKDIREGRWSPGKGRIDVPMVTGAMTPGGVGGAQQVAADNPQGFTRSLSAPTQARPSLRSLPFLGDSIEEE